MKTIRFTLHDRIACAAGEDNPNWYGYVRKCLRQNNFDLKRTFLKSRNDAIREEIYEERDS